MFTNPLPDDNDYWVEVTDFAKSHYIKAFRKKYPGRQ